MHDCCCHPFCHRRGRHPRLHGHVFECPELNEKFHFDFKRKPYVEKTKKISYFESFDFDESKRRFTGLIRWSNPDEKVVETWFDFYFSSDYRSIENVQRKNYDSNRRNINARWRLNSVGYVYVKSESPEPKKSQNSQRKSFGVDLELCPVIGGVPAVLVLCSECMENKLSKSVGVYRAPGNRKVHNKIIKMMNDKKTDLVEIREKLKDVDPLTLGMLIRSFCHRLPHPLLSDTFAMAFEQILILENDIDQIRAIKNLLDSQLSRLSYDTLRHLVLHFDSIACNQTLTKMDSYNIALVFAPDLFSRPLSQNSNYASPAEMLAMAKNLQNRCQMLYLLISRAKYVFGDESFTHVPKLANKFKTGHFKTLSSLL